MKSTKSKNSLAAWLRMLTRIPSRKRFFAAAVFTSGCIGLAASGPGERPDHTRNIAAQIEQSAKGESVNFGGLPNPAVPVNIAINAGQVTALYAVEGDATSADSASLCTISGNTNPSCPNNILSLGLTIRTIQSANLQLIFWGTSWQTVSTSGATDDATAAANVTAAVGTMINGPYLSQLSQYGFHSLNLLQPVKVNSNPPAQFVYSDVANLVQRLIYSGQVPLPSPSVLYMVILSSAGSYQPADARGAHFDPGLCPATILGFCLSSQPAPVGWVGNGSADYISSVLSHELVEMITDPFPSQSPGWLMSRTINSGTELGDACNHTVDRPNGVLVQAYWSQAHRACIIPVSSGAMIWSAELSDSRQYLAEQYTSIKFVDVNGDGLADLCFRDPTQGILCALSTGAAFTRASLWSSDFGPLYSADISDWSTIQYADVNGDGKMDVCGRYIDGIHCALSNGSSFNSATMWAPMFSNVNHWSDAPYYYGTIRFADVNGDGKADVCGRGTLGVYCALSNGAGFGTVTLWSNGFANSATASNPTGWASSPSYWTTIQYADVNGDGKVDVCGRSSAGVVCALSTGLSFGAAGLWTTQYSDASGWNTPSLYTTIHFADLNGDGKADVCGRGFGGFYCGLSTSGAFIDSFTMVTPNFSDWNGWNVDYHYDTLTFVDVNGDGKADLCGRGNDGIYCAISTSSASVVAFDPVLMRVNAFGDSAGWGSDPSLWATVQPARVAGRKTARFCSRGPLGVLCSME